MIAAVPNQAKNPMTATVNPPKPLIRDAEHYHHLFSRTKWWVILSGPLVFLAALAYVFLIMRPENPKLSARTLIGMEHATDVSGLKVGVTSNLGREDIMMSRTFLRGVVQKLSLQVWTKPYARESMFDLMKIDSSAPCGTYSVHFNPKKKGEFYVLYFDTTATSVPLIGVLPGTKFKNLVAGNWVRDSIVRMRGMEFKFSRSQRSQLRDFDFQVVDIRVAVEDVYRSLTIKRADPEKGINYIAVLLESRDYALAATTANTIADGFIDKNFSYRQQRARGIVGSLDKQLEISQANLAAADEKMRDFRSLNPQVGLTQQAQETVSNLARLDNGIQGRASDISYAENLKQEYQSADSSQILQLARVIADFLAANAIPVGRTLKEDLDHLMEQQLKLNESYGLEHPLVLENKRNINRVATTILTALDKFINKGKTDILQKNRTGEQLSIKLRKLPALEMQLGELQRKQQIFSDIYSAVLSSFNKAKVEDAVSVTDFYVMDYAVAPLAPPVNNSQLFFLFILLSIVVSVVPVLGYDFFDKSVRSQRQLESVTGRQVLESVPAFNQVKAGPVKGKYGLRQLINVPCNPIFTREIFDALQIKINLHLLKSDNKIMLVSSLEDGAGKSTISSNLAVSYALRGNRTLLVDGDLRRGTVAETFNLPDSGGFASMLSNPGPLSDDDCQRYLVKSVIPNLYLLPASMESTNPGILLSSPRMLEFKKFCMKYMDYVVIDTPPLGAVSDAAVLQNVFTNYLFVVRYGKTRVADLVNRINEFDQLPQKVMGYILNHASLNSVGSYRRYSSYYTR